MSKDRRDGIQFHSSDPMHTFMPFIMGDRTDNEAVLNATFDMTAVVDYLKKKNDQNPQFNTPYSMWSLPPWQRPST